MTNKRYRVDFYDAFDGWIWRDSGECPYDYETLEDAKAECIKKSAGKTFGMGEHYGVIDLEQNREVFCGRNLS